MARYSDEFSYYALMNNALIHDNGCVSIFIEVLGSDLKFEEHSGNWETIISKLPKKVQAEFHLVRDKDSQKIDEYLDLKPVRTNKIVEIIRKEYAEELKLRSMHNSIFLVLTIRSGRSPKKQLKAINSLIDWVKTNLNKEDNRILNEDEIQELINFSLIGQRIAYQLENRFVLSDQLCQSSPVEHNRGFRIGDKYFRSGLLYLYPSTSVGWVSLLARLPIQTHICQIIEPLEVERAEKITDTEQKRMTKLRDEKNMVQRQIRKASDNQEFIQTVLENGLSTYKNAYYISIFGDWDQEEEIENYWVGIQSLISTASEKGKLLDDFQFSIPSYCYMAFGMGINSPFKRIDHSDQILSMLPIHQSHTGDSNPSSIRMRSDGSVFGWNPTLMETPHCITVAKTGAGKGVDTAMEILENHRAGLNHAILEIGNSYQWLVEALGGHYIAIDPNKTCINPLPTFEEYNKTKDKVQLIGTVIQGIAFLLTKDQKTDLNTEQSAGVNQALLNLYSENRSEESKAIRPSVSRFKKALLGLTNENEAVMKSAKEMGQSLDAFLRTAEGSIFKGEDNLNLDNDIIGVDLKEAGQNPKLLRFYIVFLAIKYQAKAISSQVKTRIVLDEIHKFSAEMPEVFAKLVREITRMGRKDGAYIQLVTQNLSEIADLDSETINSMSVVNLLYRKTQHRDFAKQLNLENDLAVDYWSGLNDPEGKTYREGLRIINNRLYDQFLIFGERLLLLADTSERALKEKVKIQDKISDPFQRLKLLAEALK